MALAITRYQHRGTVLARWIVIATACQLAIHQYLVAVEAATLCTETQAYRHLAVGTIGLYRDRARHANTARGSVWDTIVRMETCTQYRRGVGGTRTQQARVPTISAGGRIRSGGVGHCARPDPLYHIAGRDGDVLGGEIKIADFYRVRGAATAARYQVADATGDDAVGCLEFGTCCTGVVFQVGDHDGMELAIARHVDRYGGGAAATVGEGSSTIAIYAYAEAARAAAYVRDR